MNTLKIFTDDMEIKKYWKILKVNQHRYHYESCCLPNNDNGRRLKSSNFKDQYPEVTNLD